MQTSSFQSRHVQVLPKHFLQQMSFKFCSKVSPNLNLTDTDQGRAHMISIL